MSVLFPNANALYTMHVGDNDSNSGAGVPSRSLSPRLWARMQQAVVAPDASGGAMFVSDDFCKFAGFTNAIAGTTALPSTTVPGPDGYQIYVDSATTASGVAPLATYVGGTARLAPGATDNHLAVLGTGAFTDITDTAGSERLTIFEARFALPTQVTGGSTFVGLGSDGMIANGGLIADAGGIIATGAGIGFQTKEDDPDGIDFVYQAASQAEQVIINAAQVAVAGTYYKLGFVYDPAAPKAKRIAVYVDGVEQSTYVTSTQIAAATFPDAEILGVVLAAMTEATTSRLLDVDWYACYQAGV